MTLSKLLSKFTYQRPSETADYTPSDATKLANYLLAVGLLAVAEQKKSGVNIAQALVEQLYTHLPASALIKRGWPAPLLRKFPNSIHLANNVSSLRGYTKKTFEADASVSEDEVKYLKFTITALGNPSTTRFENVKKHASQFGPNLLRNVSKVIAKIDGDTIITDLNSEETKSSTGLSKRSVQKLEERYAQQDAMFQLIMGRAPKKGEKIPNATLQQLKTQSPEMDNRVAAYRAAQRSIRVQFDIDFAEFMSKHQGPIPVHEAYAHMMNIGYRDSWIVKATKKIPLLIGLSSAKPKYFTTEGHALATGIPPDAAISFTNKTYDAKTGSGAYLTYKSPGANGITRVYTEKHNVTATEKKFDTAGKVDKSIDKVVARWTKDLVSKDIQVAQAATVCMLTYLTGMRVGSRTTSAASMTGEMTYGALSLRPRHIRIAGASVSLTYRGKKGVEQKHTIPLKEVGAKRVAENLKEFKADKSGEDLVFDEITYSYLSGTYLKKSGYPAGLHKLRHVRGTNLVIELLKKMNFAYSPKALNMTQQQKEADKFIIEQIITPVSQLLGHKSGTGKELWRTTIKSYLNPAPIIAWYKERNLRLPKWLPAKASAE